MIFRRYTLESSNNPWMKYATQKSIFGGALVMDKTALNTLDQVIHGNHPKFALARA